MSTPSGYYPQEPYYAPGWQAPVPDDRPGQGGDGTPGRHGGPGRSARRWVVRVALAIGATLLALVVVVVVRTWFDQQPLGDVTGAVSATPRQLVVGHCVRDLPEDGAVGRVTVVPCDEPHDAEVVAVHDLGEGTWPGQEAVDDEAADACEMDRTQRDAGFRAVVWTPDAAGWRQGDRVAHCLAWATEGPVTGAWTAGQVPEG